MFNDLDKTHLINLTSIIKNKVKFNDMDVEFVSKCYHSLKWLQDLSPKLDRAIELERAVSDFNDILKRETEGLQKHNEELENELKELHKELKKIKGANRRASKKKV